MESTAKKLDIYTAREYYEAVKNHDGLTELFKGEIVYFASPSIEHQRIVRDITAEIRNYISANKGKCEVFSAPTDVKLDDSNIVIPDIFIACNPDKFDEQKYNGAPDLIIEVLSSNRAHDLYEKLALYQSHGVREYWIIDPKYSRTLVYFFEESELCRLFGFDESISVNIYKNNETKLEINIKELLK